MIEGMVYHPVDVYKQQIGKSQMFNGTTHYFYGNFNSYVKLPEGK